MENATILDLTKIGSSSPKASSPTTSGPDALGQPSIDLRGRLEVGEPVEVLSSFDSRWTHGFSVAVVDEAMVKLQRLSDGRILPVWFPAAMIRPAALR
ncbi:MAG TPA: hypothetical protein VL068_10015 [Microthrixaceae bacterium]|nr:hypothetical protein [Microthrixaceae bacterium]